MKLEEFLTQDKFINVVVIAFGLKSRNMGTNLAVFHPIINKIDDNSWTFSDSENGLVITIESRELEVLEYNDTTYHLTIGTSDCEKFEGLGLGL